MADLRTFETEERRLAILGLLQEDPDFTLNEDILNRGLEQLGLAASDAVLRTDLMHLKENALVSLEIMGDLYVATLLRRAIAVIRGYETAPGVARPKPGRR